MAKNQQSRRSRLSRDSRRSRTGEWSTPARRSRTGRISGRLGRPRRKAKGAAPGRRPQRKGIE